MGLEGLQNMGKAGSMAGLKTFIWQKPATSLAKKRKSAASTVTVPVRRSLIRQEKPSVLLTSKTRRSM